VLADAQHVFVLICAGVLQRVRASAYSPINVLALFQIAAHNCSSVHSSSYSKMEKNSIKKSVLLEKITKCIDERNKIDTAMSSDEIAFCLSHLDPSRGTRFIDMLFQQELLSESIFKICGFKLHVYKAVSDLCDTTLVMDIVKYIPLEAIEFVDNEESAQFLMSKDNFKIHVEGNLETISFSAEVYTKLPTNTQIPVAALLIKGIRPATLNFLLGLDYMEDIVPSDIIFYHAASFVPTLHRTRLSKVANFEVFDCLYKAGADFSVLQDGIPIGHAIIEDVTISDALVSSALNYLFKGKCPKTITTLSGLNTVECAAQSGRWAVVHYLWSAHGMRPANETIKNTSIPIKFMRLFVECIADENDVYRVTMKRLLQLSTETPVAIKCGSGTFWVPESILKSHCVCSTFPLDASEFSRDAVKCFVGWLYEAAIPRQLWEGPSGALRDEMIHFATKFEVSKLKTHLIQQDGASMKGIQCALQAAIMTSNPGAIKKAIGLCVSKYHEIVKESWLYEMPLEVQMQINVEAVKRRRFV